jgi:transcriptional regulator with XRE-family HTH domain
MPEGKTSSVFPIMSQAPGTVLRTLRELTGLGVSEVAARANVSESYLVRVEAGEATPTDAWLGFVASILADALIEKSPEPDDPPASPQK